MNLIPQSSLEVPSTDISKKVLIITLLIFAVLITAVTFTHNIQISNFLELETVDTLENVERVQNAVATKQGYLAYSVQDWACWDDTCQFVEDQNQEYIEVDLQNETLAGIDVNLMLFVNESGTLVYTKSIDIETEEEVPVPSRLLEMIEDGTLLSEDEDDKISGFVLLDENPMFIACHPILTTKYEGPSRGTLIFGRYLDSDLIKHFKEVTCSSLLMYRVDEEMPPDFLNEYSLVTEVPGRIVVEPLSEERIAGYFELNDIAGEPALIVRADFPRNLYSQSKKTLDYMYFFLLLTGLLTGVGVKLALDRLFVSRLTEIDDFVTNVRAEKDLSKRLELKDNDELFRLSREINGMLNEIDLAEQELKTQEREKKVILDSLNEPVVFVDPDLYIIWANKAALEHMGMELEEAVGLSQKVAPGVNSQAVEYLHLEDAFAKEEKKAGELSAGDGTVWSIQAVSVTDDTGKILGILETWRNITESKKAEKLFQEKQIAEAANRTKSEFLANMSHELRTPLNSIIGFSDLLHEQIFGELNKKQLRYVGNISKGGKHLLNLINDILDLSKVEAGKMELKYSEFELAGKLNSVKSLMAPIASRKNIEIKIDVDSGLTTIYADEARFMQVLYNLLDNAIKFSNEKGIANVEAKRKGEMVEIRVTDTGIGIEEKDQSKLFRAFSQVDSSSSKIFQGTGLGLSLVKQIAQMHGGYVWFRSKPGEGSTFAFTLPIKGKKGAVFNEEVREGEGDD